MGGNAVAWRKTQALAPWLAALAALLIIPGLSLLPPDHLLHVSSNVLPVLGKWTCCAIAALALDLIWGYAGILSLGHGLFFAMGGYVMGMHLSQAAAQAGLYRTALPPFMDYLSWDHLPFFWQGMASFPYAMAMVVLVPALLAAAFGYFTFRARIGGVYFAIITQAVTYAAMLALFLNEVGLGGNNGLTDFKVLLGLSLQDGATRAGLYAASVLMLLAAYLLCRRLTQGPMGQVLVALRDAEPRLMCLGYNPLPHKVFIWTLSAMLCALAGALYVPQAGIINPSELEPSRSVEMAIWVSVGGRGTLVGAVMGALLVNAARSWCTATFPEAWLFILAALFIGVTLFAPGGLMGFWQSRHRPR